MIRKTLNDLELENALEDLFGLPDDTEKSDDNLEPDEDETQFSTARLQRILENIDDSSVQHNLPIPVSLETIDDQPNSPCQQSETNSPVLVTLESRLITRPSNIPSTPSNSGRSRPPPRTPHSHVPQGKEYCAHDLMHSLFPKMSTQALITLTTTLHCAMLQYFS